jgi:hypothetical protein
MQTFFPYSTPQTIRTILDYKRLGKQRVEGYQILKTLRGDSTGWKNHPAVKMWRGHMPALLDYTLAMCEEWTSRGYTDTLSDKLFEEFGDLIDTTITYPLWCERQDVLDSHKAMLYLKDPAHYALFAPYSHITAYVWPV